MNITEIDFYPELTFKTSRSGGAGGQNVNKVSTKVELNFYIDNSSLLTDEEKNLLKVNLKNKITKEGFLQLVSQTERTQLLNKEKVIKRFYALIEKALTPQKPRKPSKPSRSSKEKRLKKKKISSEKKKSRREKFD